jgi:hypothetical protein
MTLDEFITKVTQRPLPQNPMARIRTLAKELAEGAVEEIWDVSISTYPEYNNEDGQHQTKYNLRDDNIKTYVHKRWNDEIPALRLLVSNNYLHQNKSNFRILQPAYDLLDETAPSTIFISYKRSESSAFALLVLARLKQEGLEPFLDLALEPGEDWHAGLRDRIQSRDFFIALLGPTTLESPIVQKEITWALEGGLAVIPIWHNNFQYKAENWEVSPEIDHVLQNTHTIRVLEESALAYNNAIVELLNRFGITP